MQIRPALSLLGAVAVAVALPACSITGDEAPEPLPSFRLYPETRIEADCSWTPSPLCSWSASGVLTDLSLRRAGSPPPAPGYDFLRLAFASDADTANAFELPDLTPTDVPLVTGRQYDVVLGGRPTPVGGFVSLLVTDDDGLAFYGSSVPSLPDSGTLPLLDGWTFGLEPTKYGSRVGMCELQATPLRLTVEHGNQRLRLVQGKSGQLGPYTVQVRVAEELDFSDYNCTDPYFTGLSVIIRRGTR